MIWWRDTFDLGSRPGHDAMCVVRWKFGSWDVKRDRSLKPHEWRAGMHYKPRSPWRCFMPCQIPSDSSLRLPLPSCLCFPSLHVLTGPSLVPATLARRGPSNGIILIFVQVRVQCTHLSQSGTSPTGTSKYYHYGYSGQLQTCAVITSSSS